MNEKFRRLTPNLKSILLREMSQSDLKAIYDLTDDEVTLGKVLSSVDGHQAASGNSATDDSKQFAEFLQKEYDNIASAHFNTGITITRFFQFYLVIVGLPLSVAGVLLKFGTDKVNIGELLSSPIGGFTSILAGLVALIGLCMMAYLVNLRLDGLQYARTVNGVRRFFYNRSRLPIYDELSIRILPRATTQPRYWEPRYFGGVILTFILLDAVYFYMFTLRVAHSWKGYEGLTAGGFTILFALLHVAIYVYLVRHRELRYLRTHIIGLDIDGVLGDHREAFCRMLLSETAKALDPKTIIRIPVHECKELYDSSGQSVTLTLEDEHAVFNRRTYWETMTPYAGAAETIRELKDVFNFKIFIFTHRPWPNPVTFDQAKRDQIAAEWSSETWLSAWRPYLGRIRGIKRIYNRLLEARRSRAMRRITAKWLNMEDIDYDHLVVERGNVHLADPRTKSRNRFTLSARKEIRIFVEDDLFKAKKLANICELVYLFDQPYNQGNDLPNNIVRVSSWDEIKRHVRENL